MTLVQPAQPTPDPVTALKDALDLAEHGWAYVAPYFRDKWAADERLEALRRALADAEREQPATCDECGAVMGDGFGIGPEHAGSCSLYDGAGGAL